MISTPPGAKRLIKVDEELGLVFGYAVVSKINGEPYYDSQGDHITEEALLKASTEFMALTRVSTDMHERGAKGEVIADGQVVFAFPLTTEVAKSMGIAAEKTGLLVGLKPSPDVLQKFKSGEYTGFSIGGAYADDGREEVA